MTGPPCPGLAHHGGGDAGDRFRDPETLVAQLGRRARRRSGPRCSRPPACPRPGRTGRSAAPPAASTWRHTALRLSMDRASERARRRSCCRRRGQETMGIAASGDTFRLKRHWPAPCQGRHQNDAVPRHGGNQEDQMDERDLRGLIGAGEGRPPVAARLRAAHGGGRPQPRRWPADARRQRRGDGGRHAGRLQARPRPAAAAPLKLLCSGRPPTLINPHFAIGTKDQDASRIFYEPLAAWDAGRQPRAGAGRRDPVQGERRRSPRTAARWPGS